MEITFPEAIDPSCQVQNDGLGDSYRLPDVTGGEIESQLAFLVSTLHKWSCILLSSLSAYCAACDGRSIARNHFSASLRGLYCKTSGL